MEGVCSRVCAHTPPHMYTPTCTPTHAHAHVTHQTAETSARFSFERIGFLFPGAHSQAAPLTAALLCSAAPTSPFTASPCGPYKNVFSACSSIAQQHCVADGKFAFNCALESPIKLWYQGSGFTWLMRQPGVFVDRSVAFNEF